MNEASKQLNALLSSGGSAQDIASSCGVSQPLVLAWATGRQQPDPLCKAVLERDYNISAGLWSKR
jgi:hypothetical protein